MRTIFGFCIFITVPGFVFAPGGGDLFIHYGSLSVTAGNTVLVPVKTSAATHAFEVMAFNGATLPPAVGR